MAAKTAAGTSRQPALGPVTPSLACWGASQAAPRRARLPARARVHGETVRQCQAGPRPREERPPGTRTRFPTLEDAAAAYKVTYMSMLAFLRGRCGRAGPRPGRAAPDEHTSPPAGPAAAPSTIPPRAADVLREHRSVLDLPRARHRARPARSCSPAPRRREGVGRPRPRSVGDRVWFIAALRRREAAGSRRTPARARRAREIAASSHAGYEYGYGIHPLYACAPACDSQMMNLWELSHHEHARRGADRPGPSPRAGLAWEGKRRWPNPRAAMRMAPHRTTRRESPTPARAAGRTSATPRPPASMPGAWRGGARPLPGQPGGPGDGPPDRRGGGVPRRDRRPVHDRRRRRRGDPARA